MVGLWELVRKGAEVAHEFPGISGCFPWSFPFFAFPSLYGGKRILGTSDYGIDGRPPRPSQMVSCEGEHSILLPR